ncbi:MAG: hypothetical protein U0237_15465 [Thermoleophilia bacterium]
MTEDWKQPVLSESQVRDLDAILVAFVFGNHGLAPLADGHANVSIEHLERFLDYAGVLAEYGQNIGMPRRVAILGPDDVEILIDIARAVLDENLADLKYLDDAPMIDHQTGVVASAHKILAALEPHRRRRLSASAN